MTVSAERGDRMRHYLSWGARTAGSAQRSAGFLSIYGEIGEVR